MRVRFRCHAIKARAPRETYSTWSARCLLLLPYFFSLPVIFNTPSTFSSSHQQTPPSFHEPLRRINFETLICVAEILAVRQNLQKLQTRTPLESSKPSPRLAHDLLCLIRGTFINLRTIIYHPFYQRIDRIISKYYSRPGHNSCFVQSIPYSGAG